MSPGRSRWIWVTMAEDSAAHVAAMPKTLKRSAAVWLTPAAAPVAMNKIRSARVSACTARRVASGSSEVQVLRRALSSISKTRDTTFSGSSASGGALASDSVRVSGKP